MNWFQLIIAIVGSSSLTALITGVFNLISSRQNNKYNQQRFDNDKSLQNMQSDEQREKEKATNLYTIIKPALHNVFIEECIKHPNTYSKDVMKVLSESLSKEEIFSNRANCNDIHKWLIGGNTIFGDKGNIPFDKWVVQLFQKEICKDCEDFFARYCKLSEPTNLVEVDKEKLNTDIEYINKVLNLYIETF